MTFQPQDPPPYLCQQCGFVSSYAECEDHILVVHGMGEMVAGRKADAALNRLREEQELLAVMLPREKVEMYADSCLDGVLPAACRAALAASPKEPTP